MTCRGCPYLRTDRDGRLRCGYAKDPNLFGIVRGENTPACSYRRAAAR